MGISLPVVGVPGLFGGVAYYERILATESANLLALWRMNETAGTDILDSTTPAYNGTYTGATLNAYTGPDGNPAPLFDGINDTASVHSAGLASAFNGAAGTVLVWMRVSAAGVWTDSTNRYPFYIYVDGSNQMFLRKYTTNNFVRFYYLAGGTGEAIDNNAANTTGWFAVALTWDKAADQVKAFWNGAQLGTTQTGLGTWVGAPGVIQLGSRASAADPWSGGLALAGLWSKALTNDQVIALSSV